MQPRLLRFCVAAGAAALFLISGQLASADGTLTLQYSQSSGTPVSFSWNGTSVHATAAPYFWNQIPPPNGGTNPVATFCIDLAHGISSNPIVYNVQSLASAPTINSTSVANAIEALYGNYYSTAWNNPSTLSGNAKNGAFQLALWELVYDGTADLANPSNGNFFASGSFQSSGSTAATAQTMLHNTLDNVDAGLNAFNTNFPGAQLEALVDPTCTNQDQIIFQPAPKSPGAAPAPPGLLLAGIGLFALLGRARWTRRKCATT